MRDGYRRTVGNDGHTRAFLARQGLHPGQLPAACCTRQMRPPVVVRPAVSDDLDRLVALAALRRVQYAEFAPQFWRPATDAGALQRRFFASLLADDSTITLVAIAAARLAGFAIARVVPAPPVYDPGGLTCLVDDFTVEHPEDWPTIGVQLLERVRELASERGAAQVVVVTAYRDIPKRQALRVAGLALTSEWWVGPACREVKPE
ncbi:MAG: hypothetical protein AVDCRST_MAG75-302 [uncultured Propionibacteriaceae bacterium]|uniref:N-acetyltransferase domain-containing protein n=1 Tax=uncultured Propionibacteriaceae bacterium TaxID=257457 RepID=A0A6J4N153_9ACTN|nr:MAG: hypothetical protein AVDCRST_MAG75-302 [uncultured Propionibacteriaceae bacterium]